MAFSLVQKKYQLLALLLCISIQGKRLLLLALHVAQDCFLLLPFLRAEN